MKRTTLLLAFLSLTQSLLQAQVTVPLFMSYQGRVTDAAGVGIGTGTPTNRKVIFRLYSSPTDTTALWTEEQTVTIADGEFSVLLGQGIQPNAGRYANELRPALDTVFGKTGSDRYLGITVDGGDGTINASDSELTPRQRLATTAYALRAASADSVASGVDLQMNSNANYGMGWYGTGRLFNGVAVDGPVLYGAGGGALGVVNGATQSPVLRWDANGKVGIGTGAANLGSLTGTKLVVQGDDSTLPAQQLSVRGNSDVNKRVLLGYNTLNNYGTLQAYTTAANPAWLLLNPSGGFVGINNAVPTAALDVTGTIKATSLSLTGSLSIPNFSTPGTIGAGGSISTSSSVLAGGTSGFSFTSGDGDGGMFSPADGVIQIKANGAERFRVDPSGTMVTGQQKILGSDGRYTTLNLDTLSAYGPDNKPGPLFLNYFGGNVQVGQTGASNLSVNGTIVGNNIWANGNISSTGRIYAAGSTSGGFAFQSPGDTDGGMYSTQDGVVSFRTDNVDKLWIRPDGRVGVGTSDPRGKFAVEGNVNFNITGFSYYFSNTSPSFIGRNTSQNFTSIYASNDILAGAFFAFSDERIKEKKGYSNSATDLGTLMNLKIADFRYKDKFHYGDKDQKKVIAQDVEKVYPQAVTRIVGVVPDVFRKAAIKDSWISLKGEFKKGDRLSLMGRNGESTVHEVLETRPDGFRTDLKTTEEEVFVYGHEVDDLRTVDYEALAMLNISATQEINRRLESKTEEITALNAKVAALEARDRARDEKFAQLEKLVLSIQNKPAARPVVLKSDKGAGE